MWILWWFWQILNDVLQDIATKKTQKPSDSYFEWTWSTIMTYGTIFSLSGPEGWLGWPGWTFSYFTAHRGDWEDKEREPWAQHPTSAHSGNLLIQLQNKHCELLVRTEAKKSSFFPPFFSFCFTV